jgi:hypothetical protein
LATFIPEGELNERDWDDATGEKAYGRLVSKKMLCMRKRISDKQKISIIAEFTCDAHLRQVSTDSQCIHGILQSLLFTELPEPGIRIFRHEKCLTPMEKGILQKARLSPSAWFR